MPRKPRHYLAGVPAHVVQRGNDRQTCFSDDVDFQVYLDALDIARIKYECAIHAYCLMSNHVHLLVTPDHSNGISQMMQSVGRRYVRYFNKRHRRSGTLWEGRHRGSVVQSTAYLLNCYCYIELNPVRAGMVAKAEQYRWSSACGHLTNENEPRVSDHDLWLGIGSNDEQRRHQYRALLEAGLNPETIDRLRRATRFCVPYGDDNFRADVERRLGFSVGYARWGRPRRSDRDAG